jgi:hypothetical protein
MQLGSAGLRYWSELGLQPVGGRKDVAGLVICELGEGNVRAAKSFLARMGSIFNVSLFLRGEWKAMINEFIDI